MEAPQVDTVQEPAVEGTHRFAFTEDELEQVRKDLAGELKDITPAVTKHYDRCNTCGEPFERTPRGGIDLVKMRNHKRDCSASFAAMLPGPVPATSDKPLPPTELMRRDTSMHVSNALFVVSHQKGYLNKD